MLPWWRKGCGPAWPVSLWHGRLPPSPSLRLTLDASEGTSGPSSRDRSREASSFARSFIPPVTKRAPRRSPVHEEFHLEHRMQPARPSCCQSRFPCDFSFLALPWHGPGARDLMVEGLLYRQPARPPPGELRGVVLVRRAPQFVLQDAPSLEVCIERDTDDRKF